MNENSLLSTSGIVKKYGRDVSIEFNDLELLFGEAVLILGGNATGKSTLIRLLAGLTLPTLGQIHRPRHIRAARVAYLGQREGFYPKLTLAENISVAMNLYGLKSVVDFRSLECLYEIDFTANLHRPVGHLSGGEQRIAALGVILSVQLDGLFLDEPYGGLAENRMSTVSAALNRAAEKMAFIVLSSHQEPPGFTHDRVIRLAPAK